MMQRRTLIAAVSALSALTALTSAGTAMAQAFPSRQINVIVSFPPGGDTDALARLFAEKLAARVNQTVIVENKTGASGTIGNSFVAKSKPDGYTLLFTPNTLATAPLVLKPGAGAAYDPLNDFTPHHPRGHAVTLRRGHDRQRRDGHEGPGRRRQDGQDRQLREPGHRQPDAHPGRDVQTSRRASS